MTQNSISNQKFDSIDPVGRPIRVLQTIRQGLIGGGESHLLSLVERLDRKKIESIVLSFSDGPMIERLFQLGIRTYVIPSKRAFDFSVWKRVKEVMNSEKIDIVHAHGTRAASNTFKSCGSLKTPMIYTIHGWSFHDLQPPIINRMRILGERFLASRSVLNISVSKSNQLTGIEHFASFKSTVVYNGIDLDKFNPENSFSDLRKELGIEKDSIVILFLARFEEQKQPLKLIRSFSKISIEFRNLHLLMVGDGLLKEKSIDLAKALNLGNRITFMPFRQDVPNILANSDIYVLPSLWEGMPIGLVEAMAMGKTVVASNVDGTKELINSGINGYLINKDNIEEELVFSLRKLASDSGLRKTMAQNSVKSVKSVFDVNIMTQIITGLYSKIGYNNV